MNVNERGRLAKKRESWSNSKQAESDSEDSAREMVVLPKEKYLEMEQNLKILSVSKLHYLFSSKALKITP